MPNEHDTSNYSQSSRRTFLKGIGGAVASAAVVSSANNAYAKKSSSEMSTGKPNTKFPLSTNSYPWGTFYKRQGRDYEADLAFTISEIKKSGADCLEPNLKSLAYVDTLSDELEKQGVGMISVYVNSELHEPEKAKESIDWVMAIVRRAKQRMGARIVVTNPSPQE